MLKRLRPHLSYANVLSTIAVFVALGGGAYAATQLPANSVGTTQLKNGAATSRKIKDHTIVRKDVASGQFATPKQLAGKLGLGGTAANAAKLGGIAPSGYLQGTGRLVRLDYDRSANDDALFPVPGGGGAVALKCGTNGFNIWFTTTGDNYDVYQSLAISGNAPTIQHRTSVSGEGFIFSPGKLNTETHFDVQSETGGAVLTVWGRFNDTTDTCLGRIRGLVFP
jgi:hypothetical protein